jgi:hypothetical protein
VRTNGSSNWRTRARVSIDAYLAELARRPAAAWAFSIEALGAGKRVLNHRASVLARWVAQWRALHQLAGDVEPGLPQIGDDHLLLLVGGIEELVREQMRANGAASLPQLSGRLTELSVATWSGGG